MALALTSNLNYSGTQPNFTRDMYSTLEAMKSVLKTQMPKMMLATCVETGKVYLYNKNNDEDETLGLWREYGVSDISISAETGNTLEEKDDGLYAAEASVSAETGNMLEKKDDGLFVVADGTNVMVDPDGDGTTEALNTALAAFGTVKTVSSKEPDAAGDVSVYTILTQADYDALATKETGTVYLIKEE